MMKLPVRKIHEGCVDAHPFGIASIFLVWLLSRKSMHGYEIIKTLREGGFTMATPARIYPLLSRLKKEGFVSQIEEKQGKRIRKVYAITTRGKAHLREGKKNYFSGIIADFMSAMLK